MKRHPKGMILVLAMLGLAMLTVFAVSLGFGVRQKAALLDRLSTLDALYPIAYSGVENAKSLVRSDFEINIDTLLDSWAGGAPKEVLVMNGKFTLGTAESPGLSDEDGKINLNKLGSSGAPILIRLLQLTTPLNQDQASELAYAILDWADSDPFYGHPQYGAEDSDYEDLDKPYGSKDKPYETLDELLLVKGMTPAIFERLQPFVTVHGEGTVNINTAPAEVLAGLGLDPIAVDLIVRWRAGLDGKERTGDDNFFRHPSSVASDLQDLAKTPLDGEQAGILNALMVTPGLGVTSFFFTAKCHAVLERNGASMDAEAVFDRQGNVYSFRASGVNP